MNNPQNIVGKRQIQRRSKACFKKLKSDIAKNKESQPFEHCLNTLSVSADLNNIGYVEPEKCNTQNFYSYEYIDSDNDSKSSQTESEHNDTVYLKQNLKQWALSENITSQAINSLLKILHPIFNNLPTDYRSLLSTPRETKSIKLNNGNMIYLGVENRLLQIISKIKDSMRLHTIKLQINIDGLPLFKSSNCEIYPILGLCRDLNASPFPIAIFSGTGKPDPIDTFLKNFIEEMKILNNVGIEFNGNKIKVTLECFVCDAPARAYLKQVVGHNSKHGCEKCTIIGNYENHRVNFACHLLHPLRQNEDFYNKTDNFHIKYDKVNLLKELNVDFISQIPIEPMHLIYLGVVKRLLINYLIEGKSKNKLSQKMITEINVRSMQIKNYIPCEFARKPRKLDEVKRWKATEFRLFLLYTGPILLYNILHKSNYKHFLLLHCAVFILNNESLVNTYLDMANHLLQNFVYESSELYGNDFVVFNVHNLLHLCSEVRLFGNIEKFDAFPFENYLGQLKRKVRSKNNVLQQIHRRIIELDTIKNVNKHNDNFPLLINTNSCKKIKFKNFILSINQPNRCVILNNKKVCRIYTINYIENEYIFIAHCYKYTEDLYHYPIKSSKLNIFYARNLSDHNSVTFKMDDIFCKCVEIPFKDGFGIIPINHTL